jgi:hypothetical protein
MLSHLHVIFACTHALMPACDLCMQIPDPDLPGAGDVPPMSAPVPPPPDVSPPDLYPNPPGPSLPGRTDVGRMAVCGEESKAVPTVDLSLPPLVYLCCTDLPRQHSVDEMRFGLPSNIDTPPQLVYVHTLPTHR